MVAETTAGACTRAPSQRWFRIQPSGLEPVPENCAMHRQNTKPPLACSAALPKYRSLHKRFGHRHHPREHRST